MDYFEKKTFELSYSDLLFLLSAMKVFIAVKSCSYVDPWSFACIQSLYSKLKELGDINENS